MTKSMGRALGLAALSIIAGCGPAEQGADDQGSSTDSATAAVPNLPQRGPYGTRTMTVGARTNWVNTGLYLRAGGTARIRGTGTWNVDGRGPYTAAGATDGRTQRGCAVGSLVARIGLKYEDAQLACVGVDGTVVAPRAGIVFVGAVVDGTDLSETYHKRVFASGSITVTVTSTGDTVPTVSAGSAPWYGFRNVASGWVEVAGRNIILTLPTSIAQADAFTIPRAIERMDRMYEHQRNVRGAAPYFGQPIRIFPEDTFFMLSGNPIRVRTHLITGTPSERLTRIAEWGASSELGSTNWGIAHELGHDFTFVNATWGYMPGGGGIEGWPNIFTKYSLAQLGSPTAGDISCAGREAYLASGTYGELRASPDLQLCMLMELRDGYGGWNTFRNFFAGMNSVIDNVGLPGQGWDEFPEGDAPLWDYLRDRFNAAAGADVTPLLQRWKVPLTAQ